jgi:hypothetical protein
VGVYSRASLPYVGLTGLDEVGGVEEVEVKSQKKAKGRLADVRQRLHNTQA